MTLAFNDDDSKLLGVLSSYELAKVWDLNTLEEAEYLYFSSLSNRGDVGSAKFTDENHVFLAYTNGIVTVNKLARQ